MRFSVASLALLASQASATIFYAGVAESGGEFGVWSNDKVKGTGLPGRFGVDYNFIDKTTVAKFVDEHHINTFRIAFLLERMSPPATGLGATFNETHFGYFKDAVDYVTKEKGAYCILDPHNYMRYNDPSQQPFTGSVIGNSSDPTAATTAQFGAFWKELAKRFADNEKVIFGLMNEPHDMPSELVLQNNQAAIDGIRAAGAKQLIIAPGNSWTGGHTWAQNYTGGNDPASAYFMYRLVDPANNTAMDVHEYLDQDFSGGHATCSQPGPSNLKDLTDFLKKYNLKAMITEFGGANNTQCADELKGIINYMSENPEYIGYTAWAAGPFWGSASPCCTDSAQWGSLEPGSKAADGGPSLYDTVWLPVIQPLIPKQLQWSGISSVNGGTLSNKTSSASFFRFRQ